MAKVAGLPIVAHAPTAILGKDQQSIVQREAFEPIEVLDHLRAVST